MIPTEPWIESHRESTPHERLMALAESLVGQSSGPSEFELEWFGLAGGDTGSAFIGSDHMGLTRADWMSFDEVAAICGECGWWVSGAEVTEEGLCSECDFANLKDDDGDE